MSQPRRFTPWVIAVLLAIPAALMAFKVIGLGYRMADVLPRTEYRVNLAMTLDGHGRDVKVRTYLPVNDDRQRITAESQQSGDLVLTFEPDGGDRLAVWSGGGVGDHTRVDVGFPVMAEAVQYQLDRGIAVPASYPESIAPWLRPEDDIQVDSPEIAALAARLGAEQGDVRSRIERIYRFTSGLRQRPFKGTTDALTALRLGEASCSSRPRSRRTSRRSSSARATSRPGTTSA